MSAQPADIAVLNSHPYQVEEKTDRGIWLFVDSFEDEVGGIAEMARLDDSNVNCPASRRMKIYRLVRVIHYVRAW